LKYEHFGKDAPPMPEIVDPPKRPSESVGEKL